MRISGPGDTGEQQRRVTFSDIVNVREYNTETNETRDYETTTHSATDHSATEGRSSFLSRMRTSFGNGLQRIRETVGSWFNNLTAYVTRRAENSGSRVSKHLNSENNENFKKMSEDKEYVDINTQLKPKVYIDEKGNEVDADTYFGRGEDIDDNDGLIFEDESLYSTPRSSFSSSSSSSSSFDESLYSTPRSSFSSSSSSSSDGEPIYATPTPPGGGNVMDEKTFEKLTPGDGTKRTVGEHRKLKESYDETFANLMSSRVKFSDGPIYSIPTRPGDGKPELPPKPPKNTE